MKKEKIRKLVFAGIFCALVLGAASIHSVLYNDSRLIKPTVISEYVFQIKDVPMWIALILTIAYVLHLVGTIFSVIWQNKALEKKWTRKIHPMLGLLGFAGFFGFFGFFFEGKLSDTLKDELYEENEKKAELKAYKIGFLLLFLAIWAIARGMLSWNLEWCAIFMLSSMSLIYGIVLFLSKYFLYRFEIEA